MTFEQGKQDRAGNVPRFGGVEFDVLALAWDESHAAESLEVLCRAMEAEADWYRGWYLRKKEPRRRASVLLRALAIVLVVLGGLCPLVAASQGDILTGVLERLDWASLGYLSLALAGGLTLFDYLFGLSAAWRRFMLAATEIDRVQHVFRMSLAEAGVTYAGETTGSEYIKAALALVHDFGEHIQRIVGNETAAWVAEFERNQAKLEGLIRKRGKDGT